MLKKMFGQQAGPNSEGNKNSGDKNVIDKQERHPQTRTSSGSSDDNRIMDIYNNEKCGASTGTIYGGMNFNGKTIDPKTGKTIDPKTGKTGKTIDPKTGKTIDPKTGKTIESGNQKTGSGNDNRIMSIHDNEKCGYSTGTINDGMNF